MDEVELLQLAETAFEAINRNTGRVFWSKGQDLKAAFEAFQLVVSEYGLPGLIDSAIGTGLSHLGYSHWMAAARNVLAGK